MINANVFEGSSNDGGPPSNTGRSPTRAAVGAAIGCGVGAIAGHFIDSALTQDPYAGWRAGLFLGGLFGGQLGGGQGFVGVAAMALMVVFSTLGVAVPMVVLALWRPLPMHDWLQVAVSLIGGTAGALVGLTIAVALAVRLKRIAIATERDAPGDGET